MVLIMKLRNKKTGAIYKIEDIDLGNNADGIWLGMTQYTSLAEFNEEWEDYEETIDHWHFNSEGVVFTDNAERYLQNYASIGNDFETKEEAEKTVEKLRAWKRLKDKGVYFKRSHLIPSGQPILKVECDKSSGCTMDYVKEAWDDLYLLFGGEE